MTRKHLTYSTLWGSSTKNKKPTKKQTKNPHTPKKKTNRTGEGKKKSQKVVIANPNPAFHSCTSDVGDEDGKKTVAMLQIL